MKNENGRIFTCGDIHGCYDELMIGLVDVGFNRSKDLLIALGDLVDRGPKSVEVVRLLNEPWFTSIKGNHEDVMDMAYRWGGYFEEDHKAYGGKWFYEESDEVRGELVTLVTNLPITLTITTRSNRKIGLVHAEVPHWDWDQFCTELSLAHLSKEAMESRKRFKSVMNGGPAIRIENVDHVYFGHSIVSKPEQFSNYTYIDTGCFDTGNLTIIELV